jgi:hypothetical protein
MEALKAPRMARSVFFRVKRGTKAFFFRWRSEKILSGLGYRIWRGIPPEAG